MAEVAQIRDRIREFLASRCHVPLETITGETRFEDELSLDSFDVVGLLIEVEDAYGVVITDSEAAALETIDAAADLIASRI